MSIINSQPLIGASGNQSTAYNLTRSLRFRSSASAYLNRTPASAGNRKTWTWSAWVKRGSTATQQQLFGAYIGSGITDSNYFELGFYADTLWMTAYSTVYRRTTQVFRDFSAWYHIVAVVDTTQATGSNRLKIYVNGTQVTTFQTSNDPTQNADLFVNSTNPHGVASIPAAASYFDGYMAEINFIDGQALTPSDFGETDTATGVWKPKKYTGTYGTNGFYLKFDNLTSTSTLGNDSSGNSNTWTVNNISLTSGSTYDSMKDVPTLTDADTANYCVINPLDTGGSTITNGNLTQTTPSTGYGSTRSTISVSSGKWYWEVTPTSLTGGAMIGICGVTETISSSTQLYNLATSYTYWSNANKGNNGSTASYGASYAANDVIGIALDLDGGTIEFYKNNTSQGTAYSSLSGTFTPAICDNSNSNASAFDVNYGQRPFAYTPPSGFKALNTFNLPTPTIGATASTQANKYFDVKTYTGTGSSLNITGLGFQPDLVWIKERNAAADHALYDAVRGVQKQLESNTTDAETTETTGLTAFNSDGFTVGALAQVNTNTDTYVAWNWDANGAGSSNTAGSITSTVSVNATAGFSIVTYTSPSSGVYTVGHGLGVAPSLIINKARGTTGGWLVWHSGLTGGTSNINTYLVLNATDAQATSGSQIWSAPTSTTFGLNGSIAVAANTAYVAYCFAEVAGYSAFGSYTGNGSTDGVFVYLGFRPAFVMIKATSSVSFGSWRTFDNKRSTYNVVKEVLFPNLSDAEDTSNNWLDLTSNGFKIRQSGDGVNGNGSTYIYMAFAENPLKYSLAR